MLVQPVLTPDDLGFFGGVGMNTIATRTLLVSKTGGGDVVVRQLEVRR